jgi:polysaccharide export outer membrane protein
MMRRLIPFAARFRPLALMVFVVLGLAACSSPIALTATPASKSASGVGNTAVAPAQPTVKLEKGDKLRVTVFNEPQLSGEFAVDAAGTIAFPLIGQVEVAGLGVREVEKRLTDRLNGKYLVKPKISVEILSQQPFYILGEVTKSGEYPVRPGLNVVGAVALAGGFSPRATTSYVLIRRASEKEERQYALEPSVLVYPGDMITVPERFF